MQKPEPAQQTFPDIKRVPRVSRSGPDPIAMCRRLERRSSRLVQQLFYSKTNKFGALEPAR